MASSIFQTKLAYSNYLKQSNGNGDNPISYEDFLRSWSLFHPELVPLSPRPKDTRSTQAEQSFNKVMEQCNRIIVQGERKRQEIDDEIAKLENTLSFAASNTNSISVQCQSVAVPINHVSLEQLAKKNAEVLANVIDSFKTISLVKSFTAEEEKIIDTAIKSMYREFFLLIR